MRLHSKHLYCTVLGICSSLEEESDLYVCRCCTWRLRLLRKDVGKIFNRVDQMAEMTEANRQKTALCTKITLTMYFDHVKRDWQDEVFLFRIDRRKERVRPNVAVECFMTFCYLWIAPIVIVESYCELWGTVGANYVSSTENLAKIPLYSSRSIVVLYISTLNPQDSSPSTYLSRPASPFAAQICSSSITNLVLIHRSITASPPFINGPIQSDAVCKGRASPLLSPWATLRSQGLGLETLRSGRQEKFSSVFHPLQRMEEYVSGRFRLLSSPSCDDFFFNICEFVASLEKGFPIDSLAVGAVSGPNGMSLEI